MIIFIISAGLTFYIGLPEELFERATFLKNLKEIDMEKLFEEAFKGAKKEYLEKSFAHKSPKDMMDVNIFIPFKYSQLLISQSQSSSQTSDILK